MPVWQDEYNRSFMAFLTRVERRMFALCLRYAFFYRVSQKDLLALTQSIAWQRYGEYLQAGGDEGRWLHSVVGIAARQLRKELLRHHEPLEKALQKPMDATSDIDELNEYIALLDDEERRVVQWVLEGYNYREIADRLGVTPSAVTRRMQRIRERLRTMYKDEKI